MDRKRFDAAVKAMTTAAAPRRTVVGAAVGGVLVAFQGTTATAACGKGCKRSRCKHCKRGRCRPMQDGSACGVDRVCLSGLCLLVGTCSSPNDYCGPGVTPCGPPENNCACFNTVFGSSICGLLTGTCGNCISDADCNPGEACVASPCVCGGNGNACVPGCPAN